MKLLLAALALTTLLVPTANAERGDVGLGMIVGEPTGPDLKIFLDRRSALEFAIAWSLDDDNELQLQGDYLLHNYTLIDVEEGEMAFFFGIGGKVRFRDRGDDFVGLRIPVGLAYEFTGGQFDVFVEVVPTLLLSPETDFEMEGAIGGRFWF